MSSPDEGGRKVPRRRFVKLAGAFAIVAVAGTALGYAADVILKPVTDKKISDPGALTSTTTVSTSSPGATTTTLTVSTNQYTVQTGTASATTATAATSSTVTSATTQAPENTFSIFWITDTQFLSESNPALFRMTTDWIVNNWSAYNGKMVIHTGDLVQTGNQQVEWQNAHEAMSLLSDNGIPYTWCAGNHDDLVGDDTTSGWMGNLWTSAFNPLVAKSRVNALENTSWVGDYHSGMNTAVTFSANDVNFLIINVEWNGGPDVLGWVGSLLNDSTYADYRVIVAPHAYVDAFGSTSDARWGPMLADFRSGLTTLLDQHSSSVFLTLNGHFASDQGYNTTKPLNHRNLLMFDRQDCRDAPDSLTGRGVDDSDSTTPDSDKVGGATVTILTFDTVKNQVSVRTYDVYTGRWRNSPYEQYTFTMFTDPPGAQINKLPSPG